MTAFDLTLRKAIQLAVATEEMGTKYYQEMARKFAGEPEMAAVFAQLAEDEIAHEAAFRTLFDAVQPDQELAGSHEAREMLSAAAMSKSFHQKALTSTSDLKTPAAVLALALEFEKSTLFYYQSLREAIGPSPELDLLIQAEKGHVRSLMKVIVSSSTFRGLGDPW
jgi:rubrerythrin